MALIIDWPVALRPASVDWGLVIPQSLGRSTFDTSTQAQTIGAPRWAFSITTGVLRHDEVPLWEALVDQLDGAVNRLRCWDWRREAPIGVATGTPTVRVSAAGVSLATQGWTPGVAGILRAGSWVGVNGELKRLSVTADSDASGYATLVLRPPLQAAPLVGTPLVLTKPTALFVMTTQRASMPQQGARSTGWTLDFEQVPA
jgi:hypothetical protein